mgnify:CR=1 FL=1
MKAYVKNVQYERDQDGFLTGFIADVFLDGDFIARAVDSGGAETMIYCKDLPPMERNDYPWHASPTEAMVIASLVDEYILLERIRKLKKDHVVYHFREDEPHEIYTAKAKTYVEKAKMIMALQKQYGDAIKIYA